MKFNVWDVFSSILLEPVLHFWPFPTVEPDVSSKPDIRTYFTIKKEILILWKSNNDSMETIPSKKKSDYQYNNNNQHHFSYYSEIERRFERFKRIYEDVWTRVAWVSTTRPLPWTTQIRIVIGFSQEWLITLCCVLRNFRLFRQWRGPPDCSWDRLRGTRDYTNN